MIQYGDAMLTSCKDSFYFLFCTFYIKEFIKKELVLVYCYDFAIKLYYLRDHFLVFMIRDPIFVVWILKKQL